VKLLTTIRRWFSRKPSAHELLRQVIDEVNIDRFCTCGASEDDECDTGCLTLDLVEWARDYPRPPAEYLPPPPREPPPPRRLLTPEEIAENKKRMAEFIETANALRTAYNDHLAEPVELTDGERARIAAEFVSHG